jgi:predicted transcriptional regulator
MKKRTRSILEELSSLGRAESTEHQIEATATNIIESAANLIERIEQLYDAETADELERRFLNSIKSGDPKKFKRGIQKVIESKL